MDEIESATRAVVLAHALDAAEQLLAMLGVAALDAAPGGACGTRRGYRLHRERGEDACEACKAGAAAYTRERPADRDRRRELAHANTTTPCGTTAGYKRHRDAGEEACGACRAASSAYQQARRDRVRGQR